MLYPITRPLAAIAIKANYRKIKLSNTDRIPKDKAVILAANHPTAFIEPCILACFLDRPLYFLVRGDFFKKSFYEKLLRILHMLPVYRMRDGGYTNLKQNYATFESCFQALKEHKTIMILAEGRTIHEKRLRPLRKGTARIALGALDKFPEIGEVYVVPVGVNYTYADQSRSEVLIDFGHPLLASDYLSTYQDQQNPAITMLTDDLRARLLERVVVIEERKDEELAERLLVMHRSDYPETRFPILEKNQERLNLELGVANRVNQIGDEEKGKLWSWLDRYFDKLNKLNLQDSLISEKRPKASAWQSLFFLFGWPLYLVGFLWSGPPLFLARSIVDKSVKAVEFYEPVRIAVGIGAFLVWGILWLVFGAIFIGWWNVPLLIILLLLSYFAVIYREKNQERQLEKNLAKVPANDLQSLQEDRGQILSYFNQLSEVV